MTPVGVGSVAWTILAGHNELAINLKIVDVLEKNETKSSKNTLVISEGARHGP